MSDSGFAATAAALSATNAHLLPSGYLSTSGNQIVDSNGNPVRIDAVGWSGTDSLTFAPYGLFQTNLQSSIDQIVADGFNTIRIPWTDVLLTASPLNTNSFAAINYQLNPNLSGLTSLQVLDQVVADAGSVGLKIIFDHHDDDGGPGGWGGQQANGLWFDSGPGSDGTDGSGNAGTVTAQQFLADSVTLAERYAGNPTVIGFDLDNEPTSAGNINWGQGGPTDIQAMYTTVGDAIQAVDPGALIIAEGPQEWSGPAPGMPAGAAGGDLSGVATDPVKLTIPNKIVYSIHAYSPDLSGNGSYDPATQIAEMNAAWGYLVQQNIAPVWIGEMGTNLSSSQDITWMQTLLNYMNGDDGAEGGPTFTGNEQPVSGCWWQWGSYPGQPLEGVLTAWSGGSFIPAAQAMTNQLLFTTTPWAPVTIGSGPDSLVLNISEDAWGGDAHFTISVDGVPIGGTQVATASHADGQDQIFTVLGTFATGPLTVSVDFLNDAFGGSPSEDRNLYVDSIIDGGKTSDVAAILYTSGTQSFTVGEPPGPVTVGSGPDSIGLEISEDAWRGDADFTISVDGIQIGGTEVATASHALRKDQLFTVLGNFGTGTLVVTVDFINDAYGGSSLTDRNLYVDSAIVGSTTTDIDAALYTDGSQSFTLSDSPAIPEIASGTNSSKGTATPSDVASTSYTGNGEISTRSATTTTADAVYSVATIDMATVSTSIPAFISSAVKSSNGRPGPIIWPKAPHEILAA